jgi:hypothetical protein
VFGLEPPAVLLIFSEQEAQKWYAASPNDNKFSVWLKVKQARFETWLARLSRLQH